MDDLYPPVLRGKKKGGGDDKGLFIKQRRKGTGKEVNLGKLKKLINSRQGRTKRGNQLGLNNGWYGGREARQGSTREALTLQISVEP